MVLTVKCVFILRMSVSRKYFSALISGFCHDVEIGPVCFPEMSVKDYHLMLLNTTKECRSYFISCIFSLFERRSRKHGVHSWWKKYVILNTGSVRNILLFCDSVFVR
jgi:hypothetical protein